MADEKQATSVAPRRDFRALMREGLRPRGEVVQVDLAEMPALMADDPLVLPRERGLPPVPELKGRKRLVIAIGPQNSGKTMFLRMVASELAEAGRLAEQVIAAADYGSRSLGKFLDHVEQPESSSEADAVKFVGEAQSAMVHGGDDRPDLFILDCGGNFSALPQAVRQNPAFVSDLEAAGVAVVLCYFFTPRVDDLALLRQHEALGLASATTMLVLNMGKASRGLESFDTLRGQTSYQAALQRGAVEVLLPRLSEEWAEAVEVRRLPFAVARDGVVPAGLRADPLSMAGRVAVAEWMAKWRKACVPIASWLVP